MRYIFILLIVAVGCKSRFIPIGEKVSIDTVEVFRDRIVKVETPASNVLVDLDSLAKAWGLLGPTVDSEGLWADDQPGEKFVAHKTLKVEDPTRHTRLTIHYDSILNQAYAFCETLTKEYEVSIKEKETTIKELRETIVEERKSFKEKIEIAIRSFITVSIILAILFFGGRFLVKKFF